MATIEVTSPVGEGASTLALHTCSSCGRHVWLRDGEMLDRDAILDSVRDRIAEGPARRVPSPRVAPARDAPPRDAPPRDAAPRAAGRPSRASADRDASTELQGRISEFRVLGS